MAAKGDCRWHDFGGNIEKYHFLRTSRGLCDEVQQNHPAMENVQQRFSEGFARIMPKVLHLTQGKSPLYQLYQEARKEAFTEDVPDIDRRAALFFVSHTSSERTPISLSCLERKNGMRKSRGSWSC
ncbi:hypothetical protein AMECASPLE_032551 [Ameca splendens]|uniref:Uncharacterized protein n=1 Tax=Ameca splendens TaxID=208324 RepID=A0ABV1AEG7_9TELE